MGGKLPIIGVIGFGFVAALCAALLMAALRADGGGSNQADRTQRMLVAARDLTAMSQLTEQDIETREVALADVPEGRLGDPSQVIGRYVRNDHLAGQAITESSLVADETGPLLAGSLPAGMRGMSIELSPSSAMHGLLYPGCRVDVISAASGRFTPGARKTQSSRTLLQNVQVLAVEDRTMFTPEESGEESEENSFQRRPTGKELTVTLLVDPQQARELQAAREAGELALSLRNPLDESLTQDPEAASDDTERIAHAPDPWRTVVIRGAETQVHDFDVDGDAEEREQRASVESSEPHPEIDQ